MRILSRYIFRELLGPTLIGFGFYTFVILIRNLFEFAEVIIKRSLPASTVMEMLALSIPHIIVLTIPMSLLFGVLIAIGRLSADSEIIAMRSSGMSTAAIYRPVFIFSFCIFLINLYLMNYVLPRGNTALQRLKAEIFTSAVGQQIKPRVFFDDYENWVVYINDIDPATSVWKGVFVSDSSDPDQQRVVVAERGSLAFVPDTRQVWLNLDNAETHVFAPSKAERYDLNRNSQQQMMLVERDSDDDAASMTQSRSLKELTLVELVRLLDGPQHEIDRRLTRVEIHKKFSIPFACLAFGIIGLPLGITNRRGGKSSGFSLSIAIILFYYIGINNGEDLARDGKIPASVAMWAPNIALVALGIYLMYRANNDAGSSSARITLLSKLGQLVRRFGGNRSVREAAVSERQSILARLDIPFPNTLDRYILREFVKILLLVLLSTGVLFVIVDYTEMAGEISENKIPMQTVLAYYRLHVIQVLNWILPLSVLVGTLVTFGIFAKNNEITAVKANGVSLYRIALPIITVACVVSLLAYLLLDFVLPYSNDRLSRLRNYIKGRESAQSFSVEQRQWLFGEGGRHLFNFLSFDKDSKTLRQVQIFEFHPTRFKLTRRIYAERAVWDGAGWVFSNGWIRSFGDDGAASFSPFKEPLRLQYTEKPEFFAFEVKRPEQMTYTELRHYITDLQKAGYAADNLLVKLYEKTSWPFLSLVMALIALPFAFRIGSKQGALYGIGIALFLAFGYWAVFGVFTKFGEVGNLPAMLSAWSANILFSIAAVYLFLRVET